MLIEIMLVGMFIDMCSYIYIPICMYYIIMHAYLYMCVHVMALHLTMPLCSHHNTTE